MVLHWPMTWPMTWHPIVRNTTTEIMCGVRRYYVADRHRLHFDCVVAYFYSACTRVKFQRGKETKSAKSILENWYASDLSEQWLTASVYWQATSEIPSVSLLVKTAEDISVIVRTLIQSVDSAISMAWTVWIFCFQVIFSENPEKHTCRDRWQRSTRRRRRSQRNGGAIHRHWRN